MLYEMAAPDVQKLLELDLETRLALVQKLWNSIVDDANVGAEIPLSVETRALLDERVREDDDDPDAAIPWADAKARLQRHRATRCARGAGVGAGRELTPAG